MSMNGQESANEADSVNQDRGNYEKQIQSGNIVEADIKVNGNAREKQNDRQQTTKDSCNIHSRVIR